MNLERLSEALRKRAFRREYRAMVKQWNADGGDERLRFDYDLEPGSLVLDLGGYEGQWASDLYSRYRCRIAVFEPVVGYAEKIEARFARNPDITVHRFGLGASSRTETIHLKGAGSSVYRTKGTAAERIEIVDARQWFEANGIGKVDLMKINIEGGEFELLERLTQTGLVAGVDHIQVQFHNVAKDSADRMERIQAALRRTHRPAYQYRFVWESWSREPTASG